MYGRIENQITIENNGIIGFELPLLSFVAPFRANVDTTGTDGVTEVDENMLSVGFYATTPGGTDAVFKSLPQEISDKFRSITNQAFPNESPFIPNLVVIATWDRVGYSPSLTDKRNTFQAVMGSDGIRSFVIFEYAQLEWANGASGDDASSVLAGLDSGDAEGDFTILTDDNIEALHPQQGLTANSNVGQPGLYVWSVADTIVRSPDVHIQGDPHFAGFQGQSFHFHGLADEHFNLISSPQFQLNAHFVYLSSGNCNYNNTLCFQHPGTYIDILGFTIPSVSVSGNKSAGNVHIKLVAGAHSHGLRVWMSQPDSDGESEIKLGSYPHAITWMMDDDGNKATFKYNTFGEISIRTPMFDIHVVNSDFFFNIGFSLLDHSMLHIGRAKHTITDHNICNHDKHGHAHVNENDHTTHDHGMVEAQLMKKYHIEEPLHGLIGQTWRNVKVCGKDWMGSVNDYVVSSLFGDDYYYNFYKSNINNSTNVTHHHA